MRMSTIPFSESAICGSAELAAPAMNFRMDSDRLTSTVGFKSPRTSSRSKSTYPGSFFTSRSARAVVAHAVATSAATMTI